jgi:Epoxide hydrolase N terminus
MKEPDDRSRRCFLKASSMLGLAVASRPATIDEALADPRIAEKEETMTQTNATPAADKTTIRPIQVNVPEAELTELRRRINSTRWPNRETVTDESQGLPLATIQELARYWATDYGWRKIEAKLNALRGLRISAVGLLKKEAL